MGTSSYAYALVHLRYTIPPALILSIVFNPIRSPLDTHKLLFLLIVSLTYTIPWDAYLIRTNIWSYPQHAVLGPTLFSIPIEELFFFVIQTYITSLLYSILSKPVFHPAHIHVHGYTGIRRVGSLLILGILAWAIQAIQSGGKSTYLGLILAWVSPVLLFLWHLTASHFLSLRWLNTLLPIFLPTFYLWIIDTFALRRGTWVISDSTKLGIYLWPGLEIEEAIFFLCSNTMIILGLVCADHFIAVITAFPSLFPDFPPNPSVSLLASSLLVPESAYPEERMRGMKEAVDRLKDKSKSFWIASSAFDGRLRVDLLLLYSFCRVADDLVDEATSYEDACTALDSLRSFLALAYSPNATPQTIQSFITNTFPPSTHTSFLLPTSYLPRKPFDELLDGFQSDLAFSHPSRTEPGHVIRTEGDLEMYAHRVAGTIAELCLSLVFYHCGMDFDEAKRTRRYLIEKGDRMGIALQYVNIARDIERDAIMGRVYLPTSWLLSDSIPTTSLLSPSSPKEKSAIDHLRHRLLTRAKRYFDEARPAIDGVPEGLGARRGMRVAVESYMEIGRALMRGGEEEDGGSVGKGKGKVPMGRRLWVAWNALRR